MQCEAYEAGLCRSCGWLDRSYDAQLETKQAHAQQLLAPFAPKVWEVPYASPQEGFRNKAKMQALGFAHAPVLGIVNHEGAEVCLCDCPLYSPAMRHALHTIEGWIKTAGITPYRINKQKGELKYVLLTQVRHQEKMMLRLVVRSHSVVARIQEYLPQLLNQLPLIEVASINIQPKHMAILEGEEELFLTPQTQLLEYFDTVPLFIRPKSFFQTNYVVARALYATARAWTHALDIHVAWDLFCGVGGFALHLAREDVAITGIEIEPAAIACAKQSAAMLGLKTLGFSSLDAADFAQSQASRVDLIVVNPPRRGLGSALCARIESLAPTYVLYSSCNADTLAQDLALLSGYSVEKVQLFDMFAHTAHYEVLVLLKCHC